METVISLFKQIQSTSSLNEKKVIINDNKDNELFKKCLKFLCDSNIQTGLSTKKISKKVHPSNYILAEFEDVIQYLKTNNTGTDYDISMIQSFINEQPKEYRSFYIDLITKKFRLGCDKKVVNNVIPGLIPSWDVQQAYPISEKNEPKDGEWFALSQKLNGCFMAGTKIDMADGTVKNIEDIEPNDLVMSFDEHTNTINTKRVINKYNNGLKPKNDWLKIGFRSYENKCKNQIYVTKNHLLFTDNGWIEAKNIKKGSRVYFKDYELSDSQKSVLLGIGLGDASVFIENNTVRFTYPKKIDEYNNYLHNTCDMFDIYTGTYDKRKSGYGTNMERCSIKNIFNIPNYFKNSDNLIRSSYTFTDEILKNITPLALAIFYIDDGSKLPCKDDGNLYATNKHPRVTFACHRHNHEDVSRFSKFLYERYLISNKVVRYLECYEDGGYSITLDLEGTHRFFDLIAKYIPYDIRDAKLSKAWHSVPFEDWTKDRGKIKNVLMKIETVAPISECRQFNQRRNFNAYDLEVEDTHTYYANGFAVHNCNGSYYKGRMITRQGKPFTGLDHIIEDIERLPKHENYMFNGELIRKNYDNLSDNDNFQLGTGIINSDDSDKSCVKFAIYECIPNEEFENGESKLKYKARREQVLNPLATAIARLQTDNLEVVPIIYEGTDKSVIPLLLDKADKDGWEGLMLNKDTKWKNKRNNGILKIKSFKHSDICCTEIIEGDGKYKGTLGLIKCDYKGHELGVGSGFTDKQRDYYWNNPDEIIGKIVQIKFKAETKNKDGGISVQFPIFEIVRTDKTEPSYN